MNWTKLNYSFIPKLGEQLLATFSNFPKCSGTVYVCVGITKNYFEVIPIKTISPQGEAEIKNVKKKKIEFIRIQETNLHFRATK
ncbi:MAG: hypothetical protein HEQ40_01270 [Lacibacter sp.]|jgi:hypothetical protein